MALPQLRVSLQLQTEEGFQEFTILVHPEQFNAAFEAHLQQRVITKLTDFFTQAEDLLDAQESELH